MNSLMICLFALVAAVYSAPQYPADISPALCPNYPYCDNSVLHGVPAAVQYEPMPEIPTTFVGPHVYPPGVHPSACPNYPFCNSVSKIVLPLPGFTERLYPPGVHPSACPNYPEC